MQRYPWHTPHILTGITILIVALLAPIFVITPDYPFALKAYLLEQQVGSVNLITGTLEGNEEAVIPVGKRGLITCPQTIPSTMEWNTAQSFSMVTGLRMYEYSEGFSAEKNPASRVWSGKKLSSGVSATDKINTLQPGRTYYIRATSDVHFRCAMDKTIFVYESDLNANRTFTLDRDLATLGSAIFVMAPHATIDLNGHTVSFGIGNRDGTIGVYPFTSRSVIHLGSDDANFPETAQPGNNGTNGITIKNGHIRWGGQGGVNATAIGTQYAGGADAPWTLDNLYLESGGKDGMCVHILWNEVTLTNTLCDNSGFNGTFDRHLLPAAIRVPGNKITAIHNIIIGGNGGIVGGYNSLLRENIIRNDGLVTNGYAANPEDFSFIERNIIAPRNGRGIYMNNASVAQDNFVVVHERPNPEFGEALNPPCVRIRWENVDTIVQRNTCLAIGGVPNASASALYLSNYGGGTNLITDNRFIGLMTQDDPTGGIYANAVTFEGQGTNSFMHDTILRNSFSSNQYLIRLSGYDGHTWEDGLIADNSFSWINGLNAANEVETVLRSPLYAYSVPASNSYVTTEKLSEVKEQIIAEIHQLLNAVPDDMHRHTFYTGYCCGQESIITFLDSLLGTGVSMEPNDVDIGNSLNSGLVKIQIGHSVWIEARVNGGIIWKEPIEVRDSSGIIGTYTTDGSGRVRIPIVEYALERDAGSQINRKTLRSEHTVTYQGRSVTIPAGASGTDQNPLVVNF